MLELLIDSTTVEINYYDWQSGSTDSACGHNNYHEKIHHYYYTLTHSSSTIDIAMLCHLGDPPTGESFGFRELILYLDLCPTNCQACNTSVCSSCATGYYLQLDSNSCLDNCPTNYYTKDVGNIC